MELYLGWLYLVQYLLVSEVKAVKCFHDHPYLENSTCEGDFCVAIRPGYFSMGMIRTCVSGASMPRYPCSLHFDDEMECYCNTNFCNTPHLFHNEDLEILPIIACKEVHDRTYAPVSCNNCLRIMVYLKYDTATEPTEVSDDIQCAKNGESSLFVFDPVSSPKEMIARNFFSNACYNVSMHSEHFHVFCRCNQTNCNTPESDLPYPIPPPTLTCHTSGFDDDVNRKKYLNESEEFQEFYQRLMINDSYFDEGVECQGNFCFIAVDEVYIKNKLKKVHYKGCISTNEHGDNKLQLGYSLLNDYPYYICNSDYCNYNIRSVLDDSKKNSKIKMRFWLQLFILISLFITTDGVKCFRENSFLANTTCEGDFCVAIRTGAFVSLRTIRTCITGVKMPPYTCSMQDDDELACYCKTDYCNDDKIFWSNYTALPIIECKQVFKRKYVQVVCNKCLRIISYASSDLFVKKITDIFEVKNRIGPSPSDDEELVQCSLQGEGSDFVFDTVSMREEMIGRNFFADACYNVSMHKDHFYIYCRCTKTDCNSPEVPIPYPLPPPTVSCYTSGYDGQVNPKKYEKPDTYFNDNYQMLMGNDSYVDENSTCRGGLCFVASVLAQIGENEIDIYYKGCISTNEQGDYSIQLGYLYLNEISYHICNTDFCNLNRETALKSAKNSTIKSCIAGATKPSYNCTLDYDDNLVCYCSTDFCNVPNLFHTNVSIIRITTCKSIVQNVYQEKACNKCIRIISYLKRDRYDMDKYPNQNTDLKDLNEEVNCNTDADSGDFLPSCNTPETPNLPYPIIPGRTKCFTSGYDADVDNRKYEKPNVHYKNNYDSLRTNESFVDEGSECEGHYCFIAVYVIYINNGANETYYFKGCISANEQGDQKLSVIPDHLFL
ncbi:hypothetical protein L5515_008189 [Caenorhabditis briggsae]|uniref:UPAR/Ly6 domain-containing protein n=1 Tax=Caenorhabditis briggsae TaxID=6238 RepID=A0AAE9F0G5_CAEBR|nr:hypothetical protein L5515_008189 [Caenorhabditis briggsae]